MWSAMQVRGRVCVLGCLFLLGWGPFSPAWAGMASENVVAVIDGQAVSMEELRSFAAEPLQALDRQRHQMLEDGLQQLVENRLLELEAKRRGTNAGALLKDEAELRASPVTEEDIDRWYEQNKQRVQQPKEQVLPQIRRFLEQGRQQEARTALIQELRSQYEVKTLLQPQRTELDLSGAPSKGPADAPITLVAFSDFQCPYCQRINPVLDDVLESYGDQVRLVFMQFPLMSIHPKAFKASEATLCAQEQDAFWPMHDAIFADPKNIDAADLKAHAQVLELDEAAFGQCLDSGTFAPEVRRQMAAGRSAGVTGTPTFTVNGRLLELKGGVPPENLFKAMIDDELQRLAN